MSAIAQTPYGNSPFVAFSSWFVSVLLCQFLSSANGQENSSIVANKEIVTAIERRESHVRNFRCTLVERTKYSASWMARRIKDHSNSPDSIASNELECERRWTVRFDGKRYFTNRSGDLPDVSTGSTVKDGRSTLFDGSSQTILQEPSGVREYFNAILSDTAEDYEQLSLKPIWWYVRFFHESGLSCPTSQFSLHPGSVDVFGHTAVALECANSSELFELDRDRDYLTLRYRNKTKSSPTVIVEIEYAQQGSDALRPDSWLIKCLSGGNLETETEVRVEAWETNVTFADHDFELAIPKGTLVHDRRSQKNNYAIIDVTGAQRDITKREIGSGEVPSLIQKKTPGRFGEKKWKHLNALLVVNVAVAIIISYLVFRSYRRRKSTQSE